MPTGRARSDRSELPRAPCIPQNSHANQVYWTFTRDRAGGIAKQSLGTASYSYDGFASVNRSYTTNGRDQYTAASSAGGSHAFTYDARGDLASDTVSGSQPTNYTHDVLDHLLSVSQRGGLNASLTYDPMGRLESVTDGNAGTTTKYLWDGNDLIAEYNGATLLRSYVHGPGIDEPIAWYEGSSIGYANRRYLHADARGSITAITDWQGNTLTVNGHLAINSYDEHGVPSTNNVGTFGYTGQLWLGAAGVNYYKARTYSPTLGRFMEKDPSGYNGGINLYAYAGGDPVNGKDPDGLADTNSPPSDIFVLGDHCLYSFFCQTLSPWELIGIGSAPSGAAPSGGGGGGKPPATQNAKPSHNKQCPAGKVLTLGLSGDLAVIFGGSIGGGFAINLSTGNVALYGSAGKTYGVAIGGGGTVGLYNSYSDLRNSTTSVGAGILAGSGEVSLNNNINIVGAAGTIGLGLPVSAKATKSNTGLLGAGC